MYDYVNACTRDVESAIFLPQINDYKMIFDISQGSFHAKWSSGLHHMFWNWMKFGIMLDFTEL